MRMLITLIFLFLINLSQAQEPIIINHNDLNLESIPVAWIDSAKNNLFIGYGHTSHGSQIISGMNAIEAYYTNGQYNWSHSGGDSELHLFEGDGYGDGYLDHDCGYSGWDTETREYLDDYPECNVIIWSWCGEVNDVDVLNSYLLPMTQLEIDYPNVTFVYMTGHLEGLGVEGAVNEANQKIRDYCTANNKILFDFADIEKYSPDCDTNYQEYYANDACDYQLPQGGTTNWAQNWLMNNPGHLLSQISQLCSSCAHSNSLNCTKKGIASWFLWAKIAGWDDETTDIDNLKQENQLKIYPNPFKNEFTINVDNSLENPIIDIINTSGKIVYQVNIKEFTKTIKVTNINLCTGMYIIKIHDNSKSYFAKLIKY